MRYQPLLSRPKSSFEVFGADVGQLGRAKFLASIRDRKKKENKACRLDTQSLLV